MRRILILIMAAVTVFAIGAAPSSAAPSPRSPRPSPWTLVPDSDFTYQAGQVCSFTVHATLVKDGDWVSTFERYGDGRPRRQIIVGPLVYRVTNAESGRSVVRNFGGTTEALYREDGAVVYKAIGAIGIGIHLDRDPHPPAPGFYLASGYTEVEIAANGAHRILASTGPPWENLCATLA
jgi:hypothetical protein